jgi:methyl-accepting chemotaxis protein PixJ
MSWTLQPLLDFLCGRATKRRKDEELRLKISAYSWGIHPQAVYIFHPYLFIYPPSLSISNMTTDTQGILQEFEQSQPIIKSQLYQSHNNGNNEQQTAGVKGNFDPNQAFALVTAIKTDLEQAGDAVKAESLEKVHQLEKWALELQRRLQANLAVATEQYFQRERQWLLTIASQMRQAANIDTIFREIIHEIQQHLRVDRTLIYRFESDNEGVVLSEAIVNGYTPSLSKSLPAIAFGAENRLDYQQKQQVALNDISVLNPYQLQLLTQFQVTASLSLPILLDKEVWGLLVVQQCSGSRQWQEAEICLLYQIVTELMLILQSTELRSQLQKQTDWERSITKIVARILQVQDETTIFRIATQEARNLLNCDRVAVYRFDSNWGGKFVAESVAGAWVPLVGPEIKTIWDDTYLQETQGGRYRNQQVFVVDDIYKVDLSPCHLEILEQFQAKAFVIAPIFFRGKLWGLLAAYNNNAPRQWQEAEVNTLKQIGMQVGVSLQQAESTEQLAKSLERERAIAKIVEQIRQSSDSQSIINTTVREVRRFLNADRVAVFQFDPHSDCNHGQIIAEDVRAGFTSALQAKIHDPCFGKYYDQYRQGRYWAASDIHNIGLTECHLAMLSQFQVRANLVVPLLNGEQLWGLLCVHQCSDPRQWQETEIQFIQQIAAQFTVARRQKEYTEQLAKAAERERAVARVIDKIRTSLDIDAIFKAITQDVRRLLDVERITIYKFRPDYFGDFLVESESGGWPKLVGSGWEDAYLNEHQGGRFRNKEPFVADDIYNAGLDPCHVEALEYFGVKSCAVVAIVQGEKLWGLLSAFQHSGVRHWEENEVKLMMQIGDQIGLALQRAEYLQQLQEQSTQLAKAAERERAAAKVIDKIRKTLDIKTIFKTTTQEVRELLQAERVVVYRFEPDWSGKFVAESVSSGWTALMQEQFENPILRENISECSVKILGKERATVTDTYLQETQGGSYAKGTNFRVVNDIYQGGFSPCYIEMLERYQVRAYVIVPIFQGEKLWGLLAAYQNSSSRNWEEAEVNLMTQIGGQLGVALQQAEYLQQLQEQSTQLTKAAELERATAKVIDKIRNTSNIDAIFKATTQDVRKLLDVERITIYKFRPDYFGDFLVESESGGWPKLVGSAWEDPYLQEHQGGRFRNNEPLVVDDIYNAGLTDCHVEALELFGVKACMVVAIMQGQKLWGLLSAFQHSGSRHWEEAELRLMMQIGGQLGVALRQAEYIEELRVQSERLTKSVERGTIYSKLVYRLGLALIQENFSLDRVLQMALQELRRQLQTDRVAIYRFHPDWSGEFVLEDVGSNWVKLVGSDLTKVEDTYLQESKGGRYRHKQTFSVDNIYTVGHDECHIQLLEQWQVKAYIIAPIFKGEQLWGLLGAYQNDAPRHWEEIDINLLAQVGVQLGLALQQAEYLEQMRTQSQQLTEAAIREKTAKEKLQEEVIQLLTAVRPGLKGDLTVRVPVSETEVGTVADVYNNILRSLRRIVMQVQTASRQVAETSQNSEASIVGLADQAQQQFLALSQALEQIQTMVNSTLAVQTSAQQVEAAIQEANQTVREGDATMNRTVNGIVNIRETVAETNKRLTRLSESSQKVSKVVNLISNFTTQTQILALNAAIEATRAGEYGRGFGVVADEVRTLARQSAEAATEIEQLVQEIQVGTAEVAVALEKGIQEVAQGTAMVHDTRHNLNAIVQATSHISQLVEGIIQATQSQTQQFQLVTQTMTEVAKIANKTSEDSMEMSTSFKELLAMAQSLQSSADQFKVD